MLNENKSIEGNERRHIDAVRNKLDIKKLPREDYGRYFLDRYITSEGREIDEYINKETKILERSDILEGGNLLAKTIYDAETGEPNEVKEYDEEGNVKNFIDQKALSLIESKWKKAVLEARENIIEESFPDETREYDDSGQIRSFVDDKAMSNIETKWKQAIKDARENTANNISPEELERLKTMLLFENLAALDELLGRNPNTKH